MEQLLINIGSQNDAMFLIRLLKSLNFVSSIKTIKNNEQTKALPITNFTTKDAFWDTFGTGEKTEISIKYIKENAWRKTQL
ncbi:MAG: hypothetical protein A2275_03205 [Bacteroidetes bacterium RIFOXYA12_FULL_35_11]|nr:MAG: hypothetical protein A2X01_15865 [Bacteroidetes bacterium GWF2_35_48]OFY73281.1 MAG: hypothetical protein A2275_03205 [Bacteroidetes bacterium RIFOXYA12_FULL_35_11]OFY93776.1 MAG: hypothetical protein A2309_02425 [Bacteroidetes bacterium RIFOXYB2_FULL_35_7]HBX50805.1 hypothetical protein [Bacteroidales bacterium]